MIMNQDLAVLQNISDTLKNEPLASQRTLAEKSGLSVGLMNAILKRFVERGWIMLTNVNQRKFSYALTSEGIEELARRGKTFIIRTFKIANDYSEEIIKILNEVKKKGKSKVILYGKSYIKFVIDYACRETGLLFEEKEVGQNVEKNAFCVAGELNEAHIIEELVKNGCVNLLELIENKSF